MVRAARRSLRVVRLKGGHPFVPGRGGEEALALAKAGVPFEVIPDVSSAIAEPVVSGRAYGFPRARSLTGGLAAWDVEVGREAIPAPVEEARG